MLEVPPGLVGMLLMLLVVDDKEVIAAGVESQYDIGVKVEDFKAYRMTTTTTTTTKWATEVQAGPFVLLVPCSLLRI